MTLYDLWTLVKHYWKLVVAIPVACVVVCAVALALLPASYQATAQLNLSGEPGSIGALAQSAQSAVDMQGTSASVKTDTTAKTVAVTVTGDNADACVAVANSIAEQTATDAAAMYEGVKVNVKQADKAIDKSPNKAKYSLAALVAGLFIVICIIVLIDLVHSPIKNALNLRNYTDLPILAELPALDNGERLLANIRFASKKDEVNSICVIPCGVVTSAPATCVTLAKAIEQEGGASTTVDISHGGKAGLMPHIEQDSIQIQCCGGLDSGMSGVYTARDADATVISVRQWSDSFSRLSDLMQELAMAGANIVGIVLLRD